MEEQRIFKVVIDEGKSEKRIAELTADLTAAKLANQALEKSFKSGEVTLEEFGKASSANKRMIADLSGELRAETKILEHHRKQTQAATGSNEQMRAQLSLLTKQYNELSKEERENANVGGVLQKQIKDLSDELKGNEAAIGDHRRSVGDYTGGILAAVDGTGLLANITEKLNGVQRDYTVTMEFVKKGLAGNVTGWKALNLIMKANVLGIVITALAGLVSFLTRTQEGIDWVSAKTKGLTTVLGVITDKLSAFGKIIFEAFDNPKQALSDLVDFIGNNLLNRLKAFAVIMDAIKKGDMKQLNNGFFQLTTGVENVVEKTAALTKELNEARKNGEKVEREFQRIREAERALNVERANSRKVIKELNMIAEDTNKSTVDRAEAARKALSIEEGLMAKQVKLQQAKVDNIKFENSLTNSLTADLDKQAEAEQALANIQAESLELRTTLNNKLNTIKKEGIAAQEKATLQELENRKAAIETELLQYEDGTRAKLDLQEMLIQQELLIQNKGANLSLQQRKLNEAKANAEILRLRSEFYKQEGEKLLEYRGGLAKAEVSVTNGVTDASFQAMEQRRKQAEDAAKAQSDAEIAAAEYTKQKLRESDLAYLDMATETTFALSSLVEIAAGQSEEAANFQKALAVFQIGIDTSKAVIKGIANAQDMPFPGNLVAMATTIASVLSAVAQAKALMSEGTAPKAPAFARGGFTGAGYGTPDETGYKVAGVVHENEYVAPEKVVKDPHAWPLIAALENMRFKKLRGYADGGYVGGIQLPKSTQQMDFMQMMRPTVATPRPQQTEIDYAKLAAAMARVNIVTDVRDVTTAQQRQAYTQNRATTR